MAWAPEDLRVVIGVLIDVHVFADVDTRIACKTERVGALLRIRCEIDGLTEAHSSRRDVKDGIAGIGGAIGFDEACAA